MPGWMSLLIGTGIFEDARSEGYKRSLITRVGIALDPNETGDLEGKISEEKIDSEVRLLRKLMPKDVCVYVAGSTSFFHRNSEAICRYVQCSYKQSVLTHLNAIITQIWSSQRYSGPCSKIGT